MVSNNNTNKMQTALPAAFVEQVGTEGRQPLQALVLFDDAAAGSGQQSAWENMKIRREPMFTDGRSRKVVFVAHCLLNQNAISDQTAVYPAAFRDVVDFFLERDVGIVQMPCPELCCLGLDRGDPAGGTREVTVENTRIRAAMADPGPHEMLMRLADLVLLQIREYHKHGFQILGIVGANRSPNCGVDTTSADNQELPGRGLFMEELERRLTARGLSLPMVGLKASDNVPAKLQNLLSGPQS